MIRCFRPIQKCDSSRLPDLPGLAVLATLRAESIDTPVLVISGFGDFDSAIAAGRLGVSGLKAKPIFIDDLKNDLHALVEGRDHAERNAVDMPLDVRAECSSIAVLVEGFHRISQNDRDSGGSGDGGKRRVTSVLIRALTSSALPMPIFLACATALKRTRGADVTSWRDSEDLVLETLGRPFPSDSRVIGALQMVELTAARHLRLKLEELAESLGERIDPARLGALIREQTGFYFTEWRSGFLLRPSVSLLLNTDDDVKQIVRKLSAFKSLGHFDHEFHRFFGLAPTDLRELWRAHPMQ